MLIREQTHIQIEQELLALSATGCKERMHIRNFLDQNYVPTEVLVTIVRARFGTESGHLRYVTEEFTRRLSVAIARYLKKKPEWYSMVDADNQFRRDCASEVIKKLLEDERSVSFAECRFTDYVETATLDYLRSRATMKNSMASVDAFETTIEGEEAEAAIAMLEDEESEGPEAATIRIRDEEALLKAMALLPDERMRKAIYYRDIMEYPWDMVTELMDCTKPTAMKYRDLGIEQLSKVLT